SPAADTTATYPLSLHDALPISRQASWSKTKESSPLNSPGRPSATKSSRSRLPKAAGSPKARPTSSRPKALPAESPDHSPCCPTRSEEHTSELQSRGHLVCRLLL